MTATNEPTTIMPDLDLTFFLDPPDLDTTAMLEIKALSPFSISTVRPGPKLIKSSRGTKKARGGTPGLET